MPSKKIPSENAPRNMTSDADVIRVLNNTAVIMCNWEGTREAKVKGELLTRWTDAMLEDAIDSVTQYRRDNGECMPVATRILNDKELALVLMLALTKLVFQRIIPEDTDLKEGLVASIVRGKTR